MSVSFRLTEIVNECCNLNYFLMRFGRPKTGKPALYTKTALVQWI